MPAGTHMRDAMRAIPRSCHAPAPFQPLDPAVHRSTSTATVRCGRTTPCVRCGRAACASARRRRCRRRGGSRSGASGPLRRTAIQTYVGAAGARQSVHGTVLGEAAKGRRWGVCGYAEAAGSSPALRLACRQLSGGSGAACAGHRGWALGRARQPPVRGARRQACPWGYLMEALLPLAPVAQTLTRLKPSRYVAERNLVLAEYFDTEGRLGALMRGSAIALPWWCAGAAELDGRVNSTVDPDTAMRLLNLKVRPGSGATHGGSAGGEHTGGHLVKAGHIRAGGGSTRRQGKGLACGASMQGLRGHVRGTGRACAGRPLQSRWCLAWLRAARRPPDCTAHGLRQGMA